MHRLKILTPYIKLDQLLKLAGWVGSGGQAKEVIAAGEIQVNGEIETRRGKKLTTGDQVQFMAEAVEIESLANSPEELD
ncbi:MAG: RNA-binding S4 domain-containing protein [Synechococcaceae cyanobacterium SM2_3_2]|nr:RNA-binding S4 domain-containing protein [Synechococcaceae cyanobacterium SM2_3_2]